MELIYQNAQETQKLRTEITRDRQDLQIGRQTNSHLHEYCMVFNYAQDWLQKSISQILKVHSTTTQAVLYIIVFLKSALLRLQRSDHTFDKTYHIISWEWKFGRYPQNCSSNVNVEKGNIPKSYKIPDEFKIFPPYLRPQS